MTQHPETSGREHRFVLVDWADPRAVELRRRMDTEIFARYERPDDDPEPAELTQRRRDALRVDPADIRATVLVLDGGQAIAHAALRELRGDWEVKRVIVDPDCRGRGIGRALMLELETIALAADVSRLILQTGDRQPDAVALYAGLGYTPIPIYEPYLETMPFSLCFEKHLRAA
ncbi:GNAT superfamily N-acetyltransferase [Nakamurella sp. UYEF19]|uniref:GNAT family N-acetyltransferase n=1 Tax=Nakamurella sp. UYEF19 TaxID=1756392 RepID=UPI0033993671